MTYTVKNFKSGAELKRALKAGEVVTVYQPGPFGPDVSDGRVATRYFDLVARPYQTERLPRFATS
jgi:hypothetical protein